MTERNGDVKSQRNGAGRDKSKVQASLPAGANHGRNDGADAAGTPRFPPRFHCESMRRYAPPRSISSPAGVLHAHPVQFFVKNASRRVEAWETLSRPKRRSSLRTPFQI